MRVVVKLTFPLACVRRLLYLSAGNDMRHEHLLRVTGWSIDPGKWMCCDLYDANLFSYMRNTQPWRMEAHFVTHLMSPIANEIPDELLITADMINDSNSAILEEMYMSLTDKVKNLEKIAKYSKDRIALK